MIWEVVALVPAAAAAGFLVRKFADLAATRTGHSRREAETALATAGFTLIVRSKDDGEGDDHSRTAERRVAAPS